MVEQAALQQLLALASAGSWEASRQEILNARRTGRPIRVAIVGGGIAGLEIARELRACGVRDLTIYEDRAVEKTASSAAAGLVEPIAGAADPAGAALEMALFSRSMSAWSARRRAEPNLVGIREVDNYSSTPRPALPWADQVFDFRPLARSELHPAYKDGDAARFSTFVIETPRYLASLRNRLGMAGTTFKRRHIVDLAELTEFDAVVNASGLGAAALAADGGMLRGDGHLIYVAPVAGVERVFMDEARDERDVEADPLRVNMTYVIPRKLDIAIGGTLWLNEDTAGTPQPEPGMAKHLLSLAVEIEPRLAGARILSYGVAARPCRPDGVRVELDTSGPVPIVHCYGQGGSGWTLAPALAEAAVGLLAPAVWARAQAV